MSLSPKHLLSDTIPFSSSAQPPFLPSSSPFSKLSPTLQHLLSLSAPPRLSGTGPSAPFLPTPFGQTWPNGGPSFEQIEPNKGPLFGPVWLNDAEREEALEAGEDWCRKVGKGAEREQALGSGGRVVWPNGGPSFGQTEPNKGPLFGPVWLNDAEREEALEAGEGWYRKAGKGTEREQALGSGGRVLGKEEKMGGRGALPGRGRC